MKMQPFGKSTLLHCKMLFFLLLGFFVQVGIAGAIDLKPFPKPKILYVDNQSDSSTEDGTEKHPFKTITNALGNAGLWTLLGHKVTVRVQLGVYDETNGEVFPLRMRRGVHLVGETVPVINEGLMPIIQGGADYDYFYVYEDHARYVSMLGADDASISGFRFNLIDRGYGRNGVTSDTSIFCDNTSPVIENNEFTEYGHASITTFGSAHPTIQGNTFLNFSWGMTIYDESYPHVTANTFTGGQGIDCTWYSHPTIVENIFSCSFLGIGAKHNSNPTIVNNTITNHGEYGILVSYDATPMIQDNEIRENAVGIYINVGSSNPDIGGGGRSEGRNIFSNNGYDIYNHTINNITANNNKWSTDCCEFIDALIYDDDEYSLWGAVDFSDPYFCQRCTFSQLSAGDFHTVCLIDDGTVMAVGRNNGGLGNVSGWSDIVQVTAGRLHTVGLKSDGTVVAVGNNDYNQCQVGSWSDVAQVAAGKFHTVGLKTDGTVVAVGDNTHGQCAVQSWTDIDQVAVGGWHTLGLRSDGTVVAVGNNDYNQCQVGSWCDVAQVAAGKFHSAGLRSGGTVAAVGYNQFDQCEVQSWGHIQQVFAGGVLTVGLRSDGTVTAVGRNNHNQRDVDGWNDIQQVSVGGWHTVGLESDSTAVSVGYNRYGQCDVYE